MASPETAAEIIALYHERWELELGFDEIKTHTLEREETLRSRTPERIRQARRQWHPSPPDQRPSGFPPPVPFRPRAIACIAFGKGMAGPDCSLPPLGPTGDGSIVQRHLLI